MTTATAPDTTPPPPLSQLIPMYQAMQAALALPPSPELTQLVTQALERTTDPLMKGFLNLLITGDQAHRDMASEIFRQLYQKVVAATAVQREAAAERAKALVDASPVVDVLVKTLGSPSIPEPSQPDEDQNYDELMNSWHRDAAAVSKNVTVDDAGTPDVAEAVLEEPTASNVVTLSPRPVEPALIPYCTAQGEHYTLRHTDASGAVTKEETYSLITGNTPFQDSPDILLHQIRGVIIGIRGQSTIEHGFGYVLPLDGIDFLASDKAVHIPLRLEYPTAMPLYDDHNAANVPGLKEFMALHECLQKGYTVCVDLYIKVNANPTNANTLSLTIRQEKLILRRQVTEKGYGVDGAMFSSVDLEDLHQATKQLALVGIFADWKAPVSHD